MVVYPGPVYYQEVDRERIGRIISEHFVGGEPVREYFWNGVRRRIVPEKKPGMNLTPVFPRQDARAQAQSSKPKKQRPQRSYEDVDDFKW
jgi:(2Fe-2S) ferredoxin